MSVSGYQVETLLKAFRKRFGYKKIPEHRIDSLDISQEARYESYRLQNYFQRPKPQTTWVTPQNILDLIADRTEYQVIVEYEQQRRAGLFLEPTYFPPNPPPSIDLVHDYSEKIVRAKETSETSQTETEQSSPKTQKSEEKQRQPTAKSKTTDPLQSIDVEEGIDDFLVEEEAEQSDEDNSVVYGIGRINLTSMIEFIQAHTDSALKFMAQRELDGKNLPANIADIHEQWRQRGLSRRAIRDYIFEIMEWEALPEAPLYDIWSEVRDRIYDLKHQGAI